MPTLKEIYKGQSNWVFGTNYTSVKPDKDTVIEQETSGIRIKSAVELNNPLIYGNESVRIANRSTSSVEKMKQATGGSAGDGGLIGQGLGKITEGKFGKFVFGGKVTSLNQARDGINSRLGIPNAMIPTYVDGHGGLQAGIEPDTMITLGKIRNDANGTEFGKFLKQTGGGNFRTIGRNILGQGISLVKDKLRDTLFGSPAGLGENEPTNGGYEYSSVNPYSTTIRNNQYNEPENDKLQLLESQATDKIDELKSKTKNLLNKNKPVGKVTPSIEYTDTEKYSTVNLPFTQNDSRETQLSLPDSEKEVDLKKDVAEKLNKKKTLGDSISSNNQRNYSPNSTYTSYTDTYITEESVDTDIQTPTAETENELQRKTDLSQEKNKKLGEGKSTNTNYSNELKYSDIVREEATDDDQSGNFTRIDLSVLPQNASSRESKFFRLKGYSKNPYTSENKYPKNSGESGTSENMESLYGITNGGDRINSEGLTGNTEELEKLDLIPFWIKPKGGKSVHFRTSVTGITETVSPSWSTSKFFGNPFSFYTYDGVERNLALTLQMFCYNPTELATMWQKIEFLSKQAYPKVATHNDIKYANPPILTFRLGDIYNNKTCFIESLSYTIPDNSNWEIDIDGLQLPKLVDVSITFKFIEQVGDEQALYSYKRSDDAIKLVNEKRGAQGGSFSGDSQTGGGTQNIGGGESADSDKFSSQKTTPPKVDNRGIEQDETNINENNNSGTNSTPKSLNTGKESTDTPKDSKKEQTKETTESKVLSDADKKAEELKSQGVDDWAIEEIKYRNPKDVRKVTDIDGNVGYYYKKVNEVRGTEYEYVCYQTGIYNAATGEIIGNKKYLDWVKQNIDDPIGTQPDALRLARDAEDARLEKEENIRLEKERKAKEREEKLKKQREENLKKKEERDKIKAQELKQKREEREANRKANGGVYKVG